MRGKSWELRHVRPKNPDIHSLKLSHQSMSSPSTLLVDRKEAGLLLATRLQGFQDQPRTLVLALPRGGVEIGFMISRHLRLPLDVFLTRKLGYPGNPEYALGAITERGYTWFNPHFLNMEREREGRFQHVLKEEIGRQESEIKRQQVVYRQGETLPPIDGYTVILVDDGIATGSTFMASIISLRALRISRLVAAIPLGPPDTIAQIRKKVDGLEVLHMPHPFIAVGIYYQQFPQVDDQQVLHLLKAAHTHFPDPARPSDSAPPTLS